MSSKIFEILKPYEDEILFSWVIRMIDLYSNGSKPPKLKKYMQYLFGPQTTEFPGLYFQKGLDYFIQNCNLPNSPYFSSVENMINRMTILPFYFQFMSAERKAFCLEKTKTFSRYKELENSIGMRKKNMGIEGGSYFKYCPECSKNKKYLYIEHQIPGNYLCRKHKCTLNKVLFDLNDCQSFAAIWATNKNDDVDSYAFSDEELTVVSIVTDMIHAICQKGFLDDVHLLKSKLCSKLYELGFLIINKRSIDLNINELINFLNIDFYYKHISLKNEILFAVGSNKNMNLPNPVTYLLLIYKLFGDLDNYYSYKNKDIFDGGIDVRYLIAQEKTPAIDIITPNNKEFKVYSYGEYEVLGESEKKIIIRHKTCNNCYSVTKKHKFVHGCYFCKDEKEKKFPMIHFYNEENRYPFYLSVSEYAKLHQKLQGVINQHCRKNRFPGAIRCINSYFIPEGSLYPKNRRFKSNK